MKTELYVVVMAGVVLSLFLVVGELAALRKRARRRLAHLRDLYTAGRFPRLVLELCAIAAFFLVQPAIIAFLVARVMDGLNPEFSGHVISQLRGML
ncbi:MAG TPA: hypothetical protein VKC56_09545 [Gallionellaceae bacterium]|nr:hypothetical protein [Gallionellaceae bacterium]